MEMESVIISIGIYRSQHDLQTMQLLIKLIITR